MRCRRQPMSSSDPRRPRGDLRTTNRQDSIDAPALVASSISRTKKLIFSAPSKCPIDLLGPVANRTVLKRLHVVRVFASILPAARGRSSAPRRLSLRYGRLLRRWNTRGTATLPLLLWHRDYGEKSRLKAAQDRFRNTAHHSNKKKPCKPQTARRAGAGG